jgi:hypothetical protein
LARIAIDYRSRRSFVKSIEALSIANREEDFLAKGADAFRRDFPLGLVMNRVNQVCLVAVHPPAKPTGKDQSVYSAVSHHRS